MTKCMHNTKRSFRYLVTEDSYLKGRNQAPVVNWHNWPDKEYPDIYNYLIATPSLNTKEQLRVSEWEPLHSCVVAGSIMVKFALYHLAQHHFGVCLPAAIAKNNSSIQKCNISKQTCETSTHKLQN